MMRILWIVGGIELFPEAVALLEGKETEVMATGGWITASAIALSSDDEVSLAIAIVTEKVKQLTKLQGKNIVYYILPPSVKGCWSHVKNEYAPQVIHIHGTENFNNIMNYLKECRSNGVVVSIQGAAGPISQYSYAGISLKDRVLNTTIADIKRERMMFYDVHLRNSVRNSATILKSVNHVIGRTELDRSYTWSLNPQINYHFCNETLREDFYEGRWEYAKCKPHTIFMSQAKRPLKGLHYLLQALPIVKNIYSDVMVYIAGDGYPQSRTFAERMRKGGYEHYINKLIKKHGLEKNISFLGPLNANGMKRAYLQANVFLSASTIENSPNSLCEAQMLGVPSLSSYVGGVPDMIPNSSCGEMYRFDDINMLAYKICRLFEQSKCFDNSEMRARAHQRHDVQHNIMTLKSIYQDIINRG